MVDFRKSFLLATMALAIGSGIASAQNTNTCAATTGAPPTLRHEGLTELTGAFVVSCTAVAPSTVNFDVTLNQATTPVTSRSGEATVTVNNGGLISTYTGTVVQTAPGTGPFNDVRFTGVAITAANPVITFTGIRANVTNVPFAGSFGQVLATLSVSNGQLPVTLPQNGLLVGIVLQGLGVVTATGPTGLSACAGTVSLAALTTNFVVSIPENFPTAFKAQGPLVGSSPGINSDSETGPTPGALQATTATEFQVIFTNIPSGVTFYVPVTIFSNQGNQYTANLVTEGSNAALTGPTPLNNGVQYVAVTDGTPVFYSVVAANPSAIDIFTINVYNTAGAFTNPSVAVNLAPLAADFTTSQPVPLFAGGVPAAAFSNGTPNGCQTSLLFPFISNQAGFDTGISIAATGTDPFLTNVAGGTCTLNMYGLNAPATPPVLTIPTAQEAHTTASAVAPNFQGYAIAVCDFTYAHGYAFISDGFMGAGRGLSEGYVANVINDRNGASSGVPPATTTPEVLGH